MMRSRRVLTLLVIGAACFGTFDLVAADAPYLDRENLKKVDLSKAEVFDLIAFLESLECDNGSIQRPTQPE